MEAQPTKFKATGLLRPGCSLLCETGDTAAAGVSVRSKHAGTGPCTGPGTYKGFTSPSCYRPVMYTWVQDHQVHKLGSFCWSFSRAPLTTTLSVEKQGGCVQKIRCLYWNIQSHSQHAALGSLQSLTPSPRPTGVLPLTPFVTH